jgi:hypothetical protein
MTNNITNVTGIKVINVNVVKSNGVGHILLEHMQFRTNMAGIKIIRKNDVRTKFARANAVKINVVRTNAVKTNVARANLARTNDIRKKCC